jgi:glucose-1-phosphate adenylyltransferase
LSFLRNSREQYVVIASGDCIYKLDFDKVMDYHAEKGADVTVVCTECTNDEISRFGVLMLDEDSRIRAFDEKPTFSESTTISAGIYILRRRLLIRLLEQCAREGRTDFVRDILIRYKDTKKIYGYRMNTYWSNIATVESYFRTNMDFLKPEVRDYFFRQYPGVYSKMDDNPPAKFFSGSSVKNSLVAAGSIVDGVVENSILFKKVYVGKGCIIRNSIILNDVFIGNNTTIENCIVESRSYIKADAVYHGEDGVKIIIEQKKGT